MLEAETEQNLNQQQHLLGWHKLCNNDGFGTGTNVGTRGMIVYNNELYVGTENHNKSKLDLSLSCTGFVAGTHIAMANGLCKNIENIRVDDVVKAYDIVNLEYVDATVINTYSYGSEDSPDYSLVFNNVLHTSPNQVLYVNGQLMKAKDAEIGDYLVDINGEQVDITSKRSNFARASMYSFMIDDGEELELLPNDLTFYAEGYLVYPWGEDSDIIYGDFETLAIGGIATLLNDKLFEIVSESSEGCELWKYNYTTQVWTQIVGNSSGNALIPSGFGDHHNYVAGDMAIFNNYLYIGTWQSPLNGCEIWRYDGTNLVQVVGPNAATKGGFNNRNNWGVGCMKVFTNTEGKTHLYVGTTNSDWTENGFCQIWRTEDGIHWEQVMDKGFRDSGEDWRVRNGYLWRMEVFQDQLYAGTFNLPIGITSYRGCQLWRTSTGNDLSWEKVILPNGNNGNGFGERQNYGIRGLVNWNDQYLYVGTATSFLQIPFTAHTHIEALEVWRYDGTNWVLLVGEDTGVPSNDPRYDGFGDHFNKYVWSMTECGGKLWAGTMNLQLFEDDAAARKGCEVWCYDGSTWTAKVKNRTGTEKPNGFGQCFNWGARSMIEFPEGSGNLVVGTISLKSLDKTDPEEGCEICMRYT